MATFFTNTLRHSCVNRIPPFLWIVLPTRGGYSKSNAAYSILLAHDNWSQCWSYDCICTFLPLTHVFALLQRTVKWQSGKITYDMKMGKMQRYFIAYKIVPIDIHWHLLTTYRSQTMGMRKWVMYRHSIGKCVWQATFTSMSCWDLFQYK